MRILMLIDSYPPIIGGAQQHVRNLSAALVARGHEVAVATLRNEEGPAMELDQGVRVYRVQSSVRRAGQVLFVNSKRNYSPPFLDPEVVWALRGIIKKEQPEIVHAHNWMGYSFLPLKKWSGAKFVWTLHDFELSCVKWTLMHEGEPCSGPGLKKCLNCASQHYGPAKGIPTMLSNRVMAEVSSRWAVEMFLPVSEAVAIGSGLVGSKIPFQVLPNFIPDDVATRQAAPAHYLAQLPDQPFLLFVGSLTKVKGIEVLIKAYAGLENMPPLVLLGAVWPETPTEVPPNVVLLKDWPHQAVMAAWQRSMVGFVPSIWPEPCPTVAMEAMAIGRPVVASRIGGLTDIVVDGETGFLLPPGDIPALQQAIRQLVADPALRERFGQAGQQKVNEFKASTVIPRLEQIYQEVLKNETSAITARSRLFHQGV